MKRIFSILALALLALIASAQNLIVNNTTKQAKKRLCIVEGMFFEMNIDLMRKAMSAMVVLKSPDGERFMGIYLPDSVTLSDEEIKLAIPTENVPYADELLKDYQDLRPKTDATEETLTAEVGKPFPDFSYKDIDGKTWSLDQLKGKVWVLNLWQKECGPCRKEMPELSTGQEKFPDVIFLSASRHAADIIRPIVAQHHFTWMHLQEAKTLVSLVGNKGFPLTIVVDRDGIVRFARHGASAENQQAAQEVIKSLF